MSSAARAPAAPSVHGVAVLIRAAGVLLRGRSGAGKSKLAEQLMAEAGSRGWLGRLVADDRVRIAARAGRLILSPHPAIAGRIERRGQGVFDMPHESAAILRLVVDLVDRDPGSDRPPRFPDESERAVEISGISAPRLVFPVDEPGAARAILAFLDENGA